jgi:hypothetical protein
MAIYRLRQRKVVILRPDRPTPRSGPKPVRPKDLPRSCVEKASTARK